MILAVLKRLDALIAACRQLDIEPLLEVRGQTTVLPIKSAALAIVADSFGIPILMGWGVRVFVFVFRYCCCFGCLFAFLRFTVLLFVFLRCVFFNVGSMIGGRVVGGCRTLLLLSLCCMCRGGGR